MAIDIEALLADIEPESPCGADLTYDPAYTELDRIAQGTPEQQVGETVVEAEEPNWRDVRDQALALLERTRDLRLVVHLTVALVKMDGVPGLRDALALLRGLLDRHWEHFHPQLDPEDDNDPLERMNIITSLCPPAGVYGDPVQLKQRLCQAPLCGSKQLGSYCLRDIMVARGDLTPADASEVPPAMSVIDAAFQDTDVEELQAVAVAAQEAAEHVGAMDSLLTEHVGVGNAPNLGELKQVLTEIGGCVNDYLARRGAAVGAGSEAQAAAEGAAAPAGAGPALSGTIQSPEDVLRAIDKICEYYDRAEPSSPVPLLMKRARKLVRKSFLEIIQDLNPDGMPHIQMISGAPDGPAQP